MRFMLQLALACGLLAMLSLPFGDALTAWFTKGFFLSLAGAAALGVSEMLHTLARGWRFFLSGGRD